MPTASAVSPPTTADDIRHQLASRDYVADEPIVTSLFLAEQLDKPLLVEGPAGVGKTEIAKSMAGASGAELIRLQCYEGLDATTAIYEWDYKRQLLHIRQADPSDEGDLFDRRFLIERPLLRAVTASQQGSRPVLLIDELDRADEEFEAFLLEILSDWQITIPELGTLQAAQAPRVLLTSNRTRELSDAIRRRCLYLWIDYPSFDKELEIVRRRVPRIDATLAANVCRLVESLRTPDWDKVPGVAETIDWARTLVALQRDHIDEATLRDTLGVLFKSRDDMALAADRAAALVAGVGAAPSPPPPRS